MEDEIIFQVVRDRRNNQIKIVRDNKMSWTEVLGHMEWMKKLILDKLQSEKPIIIDGRSLKAN